MVTTLVSPSSAARSSVYDIAHWWSLQSLQLPPHDRVDPTTSFSRPACLSTSHKHIMDPESGQIMWRPSNESINIRVRLASHPYPDRHADHPPPRPPYVSYHRSGIEGCVRSASSEEARRHPNIQRDRRISPGLVSGLGSSRSRLRLQQL